MSERTSGGGSPASIKGRGGKKHRGCHMLTAVF